jgi:hypothetical protein
MYSIYVFSIVSYLSFSSDVQSKATKDANILKKGFYYIKWFLLGSLLAIVRLPFVALFWVLLLAIDTGLRFVRPAPAPVLHSFVSFSASISCLMACLGYFCFLGGYRCQWDSCDDHFRD